MVVVSIRFLSGRYHATPWGRHVNEGVPEWPPSPWRLLRGLVASWKKTAPELDEGRVGRLLHMLSSPPQFHLPAAAVSVTRHYMPDDRGRTSMVFDTFAALDKSNPVQAIWPSLNLQPDDKALLQRLLEGLTYLGRAESWCEAVLDDHPQPINCTPIDSDEAVGEDFEPVRVLSADPESEPKHLLESLLLDTGEIRGKKKRLDPPGSRWVEYARAATALTSGIAETEASAISRRSRRRDNEKIVVVRFKLHANPLPLLTDALKVAEETRRACMHHYGERNAGESSPVLSGRNEQGLLRGHRHAHYLVEDKDLDGKLDHLTIFAPGGFYASDLDAVTALRYVNRGKDVEPIYLLLLGLLTSNRLHASPYPCGWSAEWESITPFVLGRHPKTDRKGRAKTRPDGRQIDGPEDQVIREWQARREIDGSLPEITAIERIERCFLRGRTLSWQEFRRWRNRGGGPASARGYGFMIRFAEPVSGPIALGYGCHFGLGQFRPK